MTESKQEPEEKMKELMNQLSYRLTANREVTFDPKEALKQSEQALHEVLESLGKAARAKQKFREAIESLKKRNGAAALKEMNDALSEGLADAVCGLMLLKVFSTQADQYDEIIQDLDVSLRRISETPSMIEFSAYGYYLLGRCYAFLGIKKERFLRNFLRMAFKKTFRNDLMEKAASLYRKSMDGDSNLVESALELGLVYDIGLNLRPEAIEAYKAVIKLNPDNTLARGNLAHLYSDTKQLALAQEEAEHLVRLHPNAVAYGLLSGIYARRHMMSEALEASKTALSLREQVGIMVSFSSHTHLLSPETLASVSALGCSRLPT
jgi:tetratricopeptide (TPR) repeat protein